MDKSGCNHLRDGIERNATGIATAWVPGTFDYNPVTGTVLNAGNNQNLSVTFTPTDTTDYTTATKTVQINVTVTQATPVITWTNPAAITYGTALSATQLNATASVPGIFAYNPVTGTVLNAGNNQNLSVTFTPTDITDYTTATKTVQINVTVTQATPVITWTNPAAITYGTALSATQLNATASVPGTFAYNPVTGTVLNAGNNQNLSVTSRPPTPPITQQQRKRCRSMLTSPSLVRVHKSLASQVFVLMAAHTN